METFEELEVWKKARKLRLAVSEITKSLHKDEKYRLADQMIRASRSVTANIAEGYGRYHFQENIQFCRISRGSLFELLDHFTVLHDEGLLNQHELEEYKVEIIACAKILNGYINYLKRAKSESN
jgi:four helix bundle protein